MGIKTKTLGFYLIVILIIVGGIGMSLHDTKQLSFKFSVPDTQEIHSNSVDEYNKCFLKTKVFVTDANNNLIAVDNSNFLGGDDGTHPLFSTVVSKDPQNRQVENFQVWGFMRCTGDSDINFQPIVLEKTVVSLEVISQDSIKNKLITHQSQVLTLGGTDFEDNIEQQIFRFEKVPVTSMLQNLDQGEYTSWNEFDVTGEVVFHYQDSLVDPQQIDHNLIIPKGSVNTWIETDFDNSVGTIETAEEDDPPTHTIPTTETAKQLCDAKGSNWIFINNICTEKSDPAETTQTCSDGSVISSNDTCPTPTEQVLGMLDDLGTCAILGDVDCLQQTKFFGVYGISSALLVLGVVFSHKSKQNPVMVRY
jgi:hypothetical protein